MLTSPFAIATNTVNEPRDFIDQVLPIWVDCWARGRDLPPPTELPARVLQVKVGLPDQLVRYVMTGDDFSVVENYANELQVPATWLKICAPREMVAPLLPSRWEFTAPAFFMRTELGAHCTLPLPLGYSLAMAQKGQAMHATISTLDGQLAANGRLILANHYAVFDTIVTEEQHQRKGLGRLVMQALANYALENGAREGLLVATEAGQLLYRTLGWHAVSPYTSAFIGQ